MGRIYSVPFSGVAVSAAQDLFEITVPSDAVMIVHEVKVTQESDAGDSESEQLPLTFKRATGSFTSGSGGTAPTPAKHETGDAAAGITAEVNNTTQASAGSGSLSTLFEISENIHNGWHYLPTPETRLIFSPSEALVISLDSAPSDELTMSGYVVVEELGG